MQNTEYPQRKNRTVKSVIEAHTLIEARPPFYKKNPQHDVFENENETCRLLKYCIIHGISIHLRYIRNLEQWNYAVIKAYSVTCRPILS